MTDADRFERAQANADLAGLRCERAEAARKAAEKLYPYAEEWSTAYRYMQRALDAMTRAYELLARESC